MLFWLLKHVLLGPVLRVLYRPRVVGRENVPATGPVIVAPNHPAFADSFFVPLTTPRPIVFLGKNEYFTTPGLRGRLMNAFFRGVGTIPVDRTGGRAAAAALDTAARVLGEGRVFGIYPEGTRSPDGRIYRGRTGVARLALRTGAPVVPCAVRGTDRVSWRGGLPRFPRVEITFGKPMTFTGEQDHQTLRAVTDEIMAELTRLSGLPYVDSYSPGPARRQGKGEAGAD
ncbi:lysophospholipid acyltransferase family protein [Bailinhaonella thermotolerans]|uniref:1-acyl-sn-glycerol-3-phosphate acyltransferase n=1 Tax=Bailinhaonella thermotolerans TaxID=1070861 RepID=A0A3A4B425_9ACTN|nr:lysophospholipid acyltransferase family protein [Bailinhaonella thermotolerans]RJL35310.1 1-acyl-sn-glycerol-3-phosphate acyltransferase [Bailinhaonella thermotolerans]